MFEFGLLASLMALRRTRTNSYALAFELAALVLLVALVAAVAITLRNRKGAKEQNPSKQAQTRAQDRLRMVNEAADVDARQTLVDQSVKSVNTQES